MSVKIINPRRFVVSEWDPQRMIRIGTFLKGTIFARIDRVETVNDTPAPPLKKAYRKDGQEHGSRSYPLRKVKVWKAKPVRDLLRTGDMRRAIHVQRAGYNYVEVGFGGNTWMERRMSYNQRRSRQWGVSPRDMKLLSAYIFNVSKPTRVEKIA